MARHKKSVLKNFIFEKLEKNKREILLLTFLFIIGIILGIVFINNTSMEKKETINTYINDYIYQIKDNGQLISTIDLLKTSLIRNLITTIVLWFLGLTIIGMPIIYVVIIYKGFSLGYTLASVMATLGFGKGLLFINLSVILQYIIYIPCLFILAISGIKLYKEIINNRNRDNFRLKIIKHTIICTIVFIMFIIGSLVETFISGGLINNLFKYL